MLCLKCSAHDGRIRFHRSEWIAAKQNPQNQTEMSRKLHSVQIAAQANNKLIASFIITKKKQKEQNDMCASSRGICVCVCQSHRMLFCSTRTHTHMCMWMGHTEPIYSIAIWRLAMAQATKWWCIFTPFCILLAYAEERHNDDRNQQRKWKYIKMCAHVDVEMEWVNK